MDDMIDGLVRRLSLDEKAAAVRSGAGRAMSGVDVRYAVGADRKPFLPAARGPVWTDLTAELEV